MAGQSAVTVSLRDRLVAGLTDQSPALWRTSYLRMTSVADVICGLAAGLLAYQVRFEGVRARPGWYLAISLALPLAWLLTVLLAGGYDPRFIGVGPDEFRKILNAGLFLTATVAIMAYAAKVALARGYVLIALPSVTTFDLLARYALRKRLHRARRLGACMRRAVVVGYEPVIADLVTVLRREEADTVAVLACPEMAGHRLRQLAWELEKTGTDLCVAPALLDVAGPRTTIRPVAGLPLLHMDHPEFSGARRVIKAAFDKALAGVAILSAVPLLAAVAMIIKLDDGGPVLFRQTRVGKDGRRFTVFKFRTMVQDAEQRKAELAVLNEQRGLLFKIRNDPRVTRSGGWLRRWSLDELPQLANVLAGDMSLVGPRPALPEEAAMYGDHVRRRLAVKPGITGLWQVNGRSDLSWDESVRLDLRYVENWSFVLDLQIMWKTCAAVVRGSGAY